MKEFLSHKGVPYVEQNVADDKGAREEMVQKTGRLAVPTVTIGDQVVIGFDRQRLEELIN